MLSTLKMRLAAGATVIGLGGLAGVAINSAPGQKLAEPPVATKPEIRTKTIRRTIHVTRHVKPKPSTVAAAAGAAGAATYSAGDSTYGGAPSTGASSTGTAPASVPVSTSTSGSASAPSSAPAPVTTATSGGGGGGGTTATGESDGVEHEAPGDD